jgi:hypothetical protein
METLFVYVIPFIIFVIFAVIAMRNELTDMPNIIIILLIIASLIPLVALLLDVAVIIKFCVDLSYGEYRRKFKNTKINRFLFGEQNCKTTKTDKRGYND